MTDCPRFGKLFGGCKFEPRYDEPSLASLFGNGLYTSMTLNGKIALIEDISPKKTYVRDVCVRCGKAIDRTTPQAQTLYGESKK